MTNSTPQGHGHGHGHGHGNQSEWADVLDLDAEVLTEQTASLLSWLPVREAPARIVDLGCGTGVGTFALLERFPDARVTAVDGSADLLRRLQDRADQAGVADQVDTVLADLDAAWPTLDRPDLVWAAASLHHLADPVAVLRRVHDALAPDGLLVVIEPDGFPRFLPDDAPEDRPGLEGRCHEIGDRLARERMPHRGGDFGPLIQAAGFRVEGQRTLTATIEGSRSAAVGRYALTGLRGIRNGVADKISTEDLAALDRLLDPDGPHSVLRRDDLAVRSRRTVWAARA
jgi:SAM-dependent methyltransferase